MTIKEIAELSKMSENELKEYVELTGDYYLSSLFDNKEIKYVLDCLYNESEKSKLLSEKLNLLTEKQNELIKQQNLMIEILKKEITINEYKNKVNEYKKNIENGFVYIIKDSISNYYKIGKTKYLNDRLKTLKTGNPNIEIIASRLLKKYHLLENHLHKILRENNIKGEWFKLNDDELNNLIKDYQFNKSV